jgi:hypothetical protein
MRRVGNQSTVRAKYSATKVETFFNIQTYTCLLQSSAHLFRDTHEAMTKYGQLYGINQIILHLPCRTYSDIDDYMFIQNGRVSIW